MTQFHCSRIERSLFFGLQHRSRMGISLPTTDGRPSLDTVGATASLACAVHCAVVALMLGVMPAASFLAAPWIEWAFLAVSTLVGLCALLPGFRVHRLRAPLLLFCTGISALIALRLKHVTSPSVEVLVVIAAAVALIAAHWQNRGALHRCACGPSHLR